MSESLELVGRAFLAMLNAVETGRQAALMAPTEILARQHIATIEPLARAVGREEGQRATEATCVKSACTTKEFTCPC